MTQFESKNIRIQGDVVITNTKKSGTKAFKIIQKDALNLFSDEADILRYLKNHVVDQNDCILFKEITHDITGYHKFVRFEDLSDEIIDQNFKSYSCKADIQKELELHSLKGLTFPMYEEIQGIEQYENHPEMMTVDIKNGRARVKTVQHFFRDLEFDQDSIDEITKEIKER